MSDKIEGIRARHDDAASIGSIIHGPDRPPTWTLVGWEAHHDRDFLLAEVERQRAENEKLRAEIEKLRAEIERLRPTEMSPAEKMRILDDLRAQETRRRAALEGKP